MELEIENKLTAFKYFVHFSCLDANEAIPRKVIWKSIAITTDIDIPSVPYCFPRITIRIICVT